ncbi:MAG: hypothetical protein IJ801_07640 [Lachnospiraceae bacterium]|nr:hypothetical protein [Lachnospiraceae bacterium]
MLIWSDLILPESFELPPGYDVSDEEKPDRNYIGISRTFPCRWKYEDGMFAERSSTRQGVAGFFLFRDKACLEGLPDSGELVRWMQERELSFDEWSLAGTREFGLLEEYEKLEQVKCRPFNRIVVEGDVLIKEAVDQQGESLAARECAGYKKAMEKRLEAIPCDRFCFLHGDCTFSNLMLRENGQPVLIDPRGYFGFTQLYGDARYDWAKLYYSIVGNYDRFNLKKFCLDILEDQVMLEIESNGWEDMEEDFFELTGASKEEIRLLHAVIWLSLTTYAWQDYDSICGAFYNGLYYLEEVL